MALENTSPEPATAAGGPRGTGGASPNLKGRMWFTLGILLVYRLGTFVPIPDVDPLALEDLSQFRALGVFGVFDIFSGGALGRMSIFALSVMPYLLAIVLLQFVAAVSPRLKALCQQGAAGRRKMRQYICYATVPLCALQAYGLSVGLENLRVPSLPLVLEPGLMFRVTTIATLTAGTIFLIWLAEQITQRGIGNGIALIIFAGIVANLPQALATMLEFARTGAISDTIVIFALVIALALTVFIVLMEKAKREVIIQYSKRRAGSRIFDGKTSRLTLRLNSSGVAAPIFASSLLAIPLAIANFPGGVAKGEWSGEMTNSIAAGWSIYMGIFAVLIVLFAFTWSKTLFNPTDVAQSLKQHGDSVPGIRPGKNTADFLNYILTRVTAVGAAYLALVCLLPELLSSYYGLPIYFGGTSLFVVVYVTLNFMWEIDTEMQGSSI